MDPQNEKIEEFNLKKFNKKNLHFNFLIILIIFF